MLDTSGEIRIHTPFVGFKSCNLPVQKVPYSTGGTIKLGTSLYRVPTCTNKEDFVDAVNKSGIIAIHEQHNKWSVRPTRGGFAKPDSVVGVYESPHGIRKDLSLEAGQYSLTDRDTQEIPEPVMEFLPGQLETNLYHRISGAHSNLTFGSSVSTVGEDMRILGGGMAFQAKPIKPDALVSTVESLGMNAGDIFVSQGSIQAGRFVIPLHGNNEGLVVNSQCHFSVARSDKPGVPLFGFRIRVGIKDTIHATVVNTLPLDCQEISVQLVQNRVQLVGKTDNTLSVLLQGTIDIPADCRLVVSAIAPIEIESILHQPIVALPEEQATVGIAFMSPASNSFSILRSNTTQIVVTSNQLICNSVPTAIQIEEQKKYVVVYSYTASTKIISVSALDIDTNELQLYNSSGAENAFSSTNSLNTEPLVMFEGGALGHFIWCGTASAAVERRVLARVLSSHWAGSPQQLGTLSGNTFSGGATFQNNAITHQGITYTRICPQINPELQHILGVPDEIHSKLIGNKHTFDARILCYNVYLRGVDLQGSNKGALLFSGVSDTSQLSNEDPELFEVHSQGVGNLVLTFVDAATLCETRIHGTKFVLISSNAPSVRE